MRRKTPAHAPRSASARDTRAILSRRKFLIEAALAGAGTGIVAATAAGCRPRACLKPELPPALLPGEMVPPPAPTAPAQTNVRESILPPGMTDPLPRACLSLEKVPDPR